ncbi:MAG: ATP-binding protein [Candidatus Cryptobacteroides sp.]
MNDVISSVFFKSGLMEAWGRDIPNIFNECKAAGLPAPEFECIPNFVCLTIRFKNPLTPYLTTGDNIVRINNKLNDRLNDELYEPLQGSVS